MESQNQSQSLEVAKEIHAQIGPQALYMLGAQNFVGSKNSLLFSIRGSKRVNRIMITLEPSDLYTLSFYRLRRAGAGYKVDKVSEVKEVFCDQLKGIIEDETGLCLSL